MIGIWAGVEREGGGGDILSWPNSHYPLPPSPVHVHIAAHQHILLQRVIHHPGGLRHVSHPPANCHLARAPRHVPDQSAEDR